MKKTFCYCDRCGNETSPCANRTITYNLAVSYTHRINLDLCEDCYDAFMDFINHEVKE